MTDDEQQPATIKPLPSDHPRASVFRDLAGSHGFNIGHMESLLTSCDDQPSLWRERADIAAAYIDGKQLTELQLHTLAAEGMKDVRCTNLIGRVYRGILGQEAKSRTDVKIEADDDETADVCDAMNKVMKEARRETYADMAVSQAYGGQVGPGIGWIEVGRNSDPLDYPYRVESVHRSEMWWDWRANDILLRDARWIARKRWQDLDELQALLPKHRKLLASLSNSPAQMVFDDTFDESEMVIVSELQSRWDRISRRRTDWYDGARKRVKLYEVWYKVPAQAIVLHLSPTRRILFDERNQAHIEAVASGSVKVTRTNNARQVRMALYAGPYRLQDVGTTRRDYPYVPFIAYQDDQDKSPYGIVEGMIGPQDEYNARRLRINWLLRARQLTVDSDALDTTVNSLEDVAATIMRPDLTVVLNPNRRNGANAFVVGNSLALQKEQVEVMQDAKQLIQDVPGVYGAQLGQQASGVTSGIANSLLIEQGAVAMGDLNDNYRHARRAVYERLMDLIVEDHKEANLPVNIGMGSSRRTIVLNQWDPQSKTIINNTSDAPIRVGLGEIPATPAFRLQQQNQIAAIIQALASASPQAAAILAPTFVESTDLPDRMERADDVRRALGLPTAGDKQAAAQAEEQQQQEVAKQRALQEQALQLELQGKAATIEETRSKTELNNAKTAEIGHGMGMAEVNAEREDMQAMQAERAQQAEAGDDEERQINEALEEALSG